MERNNKTSLKAMIFVGNGFDVAHGYKTKYIDFYTNSIELKELASKGNVLCQHILANIKGDLWQDLECGLHEYSKSLTLKHGEGDIISSTNFKHEFNELRSALFNYIKRASNASIMNNPGYFVGELSKEWARLDYQIVSFNYTPIVAAYTNDTNLYSSNLSINKEKIIYQHGCMYNPERGIDNTAADIVLGIDDSQKVEQLHSFLYKSLQKVSDVTDLVDSMEEKTVFIVFGCSMGPSDHNYFSSLFDGNMQNKTYIIYGHGNDTLDSIKGYAMEYTGGIYNFQTKNHNKIHFIDDSIQRSAMSETKNVIDGLLTTK